MVPVDLPRVVLVDQILGLMFVAGIIAKKLRRKLVLLLQYANKRLFFNA